MKSEILIFKDYDEEKISYYKWTPESVEPRGAIQIAHGLAETAGRYERLAEFLCSNGYMVYANDHRGHGRTAGSLDNLGYVGEDGYNWMVKDMKQLNDLIREENNKLPIFLLGHSMGSHLSQRYITLHGSSIKGVILSGTSGRLGPVLYVGLAIANIGCKYKGPRAKAYLLNRMSFGGYNKAFKPNETEFDWLSRDKEEVRKYIADDHCGFVPTQSFFRDMMRTYKLLHKPETMKSVPHNLPIFLISGDKDPVGANTKSVMGLIKLYKAAGVSDVTYKFYKDARHEIFNEINRAEVMQDTLDWINGHLKN